MTGFRDRVTVLLFVILVVAALVGVSFAAGYLIGKLIL